MIRPDKPIARRLFHLDCELHLLYSAPINIGEDEVVVPGFALFHRLLGVEQVVARKTLRHFALLAVDELVDILDGFVQRAHFAIIDKEKYRCNYDEHHN